MAISSAENLFKCLFSTHKFCGFSILGPWFARKNLMYEKRKIQIWQPMKDIILKSGSDPLLPGLILTWTFYYVILLIYHQVKCIKPTMDHVSNQYNWKHIISWILYGEKRFKWFWRFFRAWTIFKITEINHLGSWWTPLAILDVLKPVNWI